MASHPHQPIEHETEFRRYEEVRFYEAIARLARGPYDDVKLRQMESVSRIFGKLREADCPISPEQLVISAWSSAVGKKIASHTRPAKLVRTRLVVEVEDQIWQRQLFVLTRQILANLETKVGRGIVDEVEFRIVPRRMQPKRAEVSSLFTLAVSHADEADQIADPVMRHIYKTARRKESA